MGNLIQTINTLTTQIALIATALCALSWMIASALKGAPIPIREFKEYGHGLMLDSVKALFWLAIYSAISALITYIATIISSPL